MKKSARFFIFLAAFLAALAVCFANAKKINADIFSLVNFENSAEQTALKSMLDSASNEFLLVSNSPEFLEKSEILAAQSPAKEFSQRLTAVQYLDAYGANQRFYRANDEGEIIGSYALTQGVPTILPYEPFVEWQNLDLVKPKDVARWEITLVGGEGCDDGNESDEDDEERWEEYFYDDELFYSLYFYSRAVLDATGVDFA